MLVTRCMLVIVLQTKCVTMQGNYPEYFDHAATQVVSIPNDQTITQFPLPNLTPWVTLFPTETPKPNTTQATRMTTKRLATKFFFIAMSNISDIFTSTVKSTVSTTMEPYLTGFMTTRKRDLTFPAYVILTTIEPPTTDIIIPTILDALYTISRSTRFPPSTQYFTLKNSPPPKEFPLTKVPPKTVPSTKVPPKKVPPTKVPPKKVPPTKVPPKKVPPTKVPPKKVPPTKVPPKKVPPTKRPPITLPKKVDRSGLNSSTFTTMKQLLRVSPTVPTRTIKTVTSIAASKTSTTKPSVKVSTTVKLKTIATTKPKIKGLTTVKPTSKNPKPQLNKVTTVKPKTNPGLNKTGNLTNKNKPGVPTVSKNATNAQISNITGTTVGIVERAPIQKAPTTTVLYEDVIEYEELTTEPFSKFLERLQFLLAKMNKTYATRFIRNFDRIATSKSNAGALRHFGGVTIRYIDDMLPGLETSTDILQRMFVLGYSSMKSRRKALAVDTNELLDYIDMMYLPSEEKLMQEILNNIMKYPNSSKPAADICAEVIDGLIIMPSKRLSGTKKGNVLFKSLDNIIVSRHPAYDHYRRNFENKGKVIEAITDPVGKSNRMVFDSFHYSNGRNLKALNHVSKSNTRYDGSENANGKERNAMHHANEGNRRKRIHVNEGDRKQYDEINNALRREFEPTNHGTESNRRNYGSIHNDISREKEDINHDGDKRKYDGTNYSKGRKSKDIRHFNKATRKKTGKNKGNKAINNFNKSNRIKYTMARKKLHDRRFGKENLRRSYNTFSGRDDNNYNGERDNVLGYFSDSDDFVQSESDDDTDEMERQRKANIIFDRIQKQKSKNFIQPVIKPKTVMRHGGKKIKWGLPSWDPYENEFGVLRQGHYPSQRRTDRENNLINNRGLLLKKVFPNNKKKFGMFREGRPSELPSHKVISKNKNNILRVGPQYDNGNVSAPINPQSKNNIRPVKKSFVSRKLQMLQITKRFHDYKPKMEENGEPSPSFLDPMDKTLINETNMLNTEGYTEVTPHTYFGQTPLQISNNNSINPRNSNNEMYKNIGRLNPSNAATNQQVMSVDFDNSPSIIDFSMKVKLKKPPDVRDGGELVFVNDHYINNVNMRGREAQATEETRTWDPYQMDKYFGKTKVTRKDIKKRVYVRKPVSDTSDNSDTDDVSQYERDGDDEESEQDESDRYVFKGVNRKNTHSKHHHKYRGKHHKRKNHDKYKRKKHRGNERVRHGTHKQNRKKHGRQNTKKRKHGRNKHSHHKSHRYHKNKRGKKTHSKKHAMAIDPIINRASDTRPIPESNLYKYDKAEYSPSEENSSNSTEQTVGTSAPDNKQYKPIGKLMDFDKGSTLKSNNELGTYKQPSKLNSPEGQPKNSQEVKDLENKATEDKNNEGSINKRNPKRRGAYVTIGLLMDDMIYRFRENELKRNVYDAFRQNYRRNYRRTLGYEFHGPVLPPLVIREDSVYTDDEAILKRNIYKAIKHENTNADKLDQNKPKQLKRTF